MVKAFPSPALRPTPCPPPPKGSPPWDLPQELREVGRHVNVRRIRDGLILSVWLSDKTSQFLGKPNPPCKLEAGRRKEEKNQGSPVPLLSLGSLGCQPLPADLSPGQGGRGAAGRHRDIPLLKFIYTLCWEPRPRPAVSPGPIAGQACTHLCEPSSAGGTQVASPAGPCAATQGGPSPFSPLSPCLPREP